MISQQFDDGSDFQNLGSTFNRHVCHSGEQQNTTVLFMETASTGICFGCPVSNLAEHVCLCLHTNSVDTQSTLSFPEISVYNDIYSPSLAEATLVSTVNRFSDSSTVETSMQSKILSQCKGKILQPNLNSYN